MSSARIPKIQRKPCDKPQLLLLSSNAPTPVRDGLTARLSSICAQLADEFAITLVAPSRASLEETSNEPLAWSTRVVVPYNEQRDTYTEAANGDIVEALKTLKDEPLGAAIVWNCSPCLVHEAFAPQQIPTILDLIDSPTRARWGELRAANSLGTKIREIHNLICCALTERSWLHSAEIAYLVGERDLYLSKWLCPGGTLKLLRHGVSIPPEPPEHCLSESPSILFSGALSFPPNIDSVLYFVREIFPLIRGEMPHATFWIVGRDPSAAVRECANHPGVQLFANVPSVEYYLRRAWLAVAPMRTGSGVKIKILEAWAQALPVVMTPHANNGLGETPAVSGCIAGDADEFAQMVVRLLSDTKLRNRIAMQSFTTAKQFHSWFEITKELKADLRSLLQGKHKASG